MDVNFWNDHSILFFLALIFIPRLSMVYFGMIVPLSIGAILEWTFIPRITMATMFSSVYYGSNPTVIIVFWVVAVVGDVVDFIIKFSQMKIAYRAQMENMRMRYPDMFNRY